MIPKLPNLRLAVALFIVAATGAGSWAQQATLPKNSPFMPPAGAAGPSAAASETIEFTGMSSVGQRIDLIFHDKSTKKNHWIGIGETKEGIAVLNYDSPREQAVIKLNGVEKILIMRKGAGAANTLNQSVAAPNPALNLNLPPPSSQALWQKIQQPPPSSTVPKVEAPAAPANQETPTTPPAIAKQETEARMLVSDLLEIGMAQRKAYEEAQRKASEGNATPAAGQSPTPAQPDRPSGG
jgi:hypothetical protein